MDPVPEVDAIGVVVPAHNEQSALARCLHSILAACAHPDLRRIPIRLTTVLDDCGDDSGEVALGVAHAIARRSDLAVTVAAVEVKAANVGRARAVGCAEVLHSFLGVDPTRIWLAMTDADTTVPRHWLEHQLLLRRRGVDGCTGTVAVSDWSEQPNRVAAGFRHRYQPARTRIHDHVHGANLAFTAEAYWRAGGFQTEHCGEDHALCRAMRSHGLRVVSTVGAPVTTSARREGRVTGGFSDYLRGIGHPHDGPPRQTATMPARRM